jgi:hypothetical protein
MTSAPQVGEIVHYHCPAMLSRVGLTVGYAGRGEGPYAALVTHNIGNGLTLTVFFPGITPLEVASVPHETHKDDFKDKGFWRTSAETVLHEAALRARLEAEARNADAAEDMPSFDNLTGLEKARAVKAWKHAHGASD